MTISRIAAVGACPGFSGISGISTSINFKTEISYDLLFRLCRPSNVLIHAVISSFYYVSLFIASEANLPTVKS